MVFIYANLMVHFPLFYYLDWLLFTIAFIWHIHLWILNCWFYFISYFLVFRLGDSLEFIHRSHISIHRAMFSTCGLVNFRPEWWLSISIDIIIIIIIILLVFWRCQFTKIFRKHFIIYFNWIHIQVYQTNKMPVSMCIASCMFTTAMFNRS